MPPTKRDDPDHFAPAPRWVKVFGLIAIVLVVIIVIVHLATGGMGGMHH